MSVPTTYSGPCEVCWTVSWAPIPEEIKEKCVLKHPHEGEHILCEHCALLESYELLANHARAYPGSLAGDVVLSEWEKKLHELVPVEPEQS